MKPQVTLDVYVCNAESLAALSQSVNDGDAMHAAMLLSLPGEDMSRYGWIKVGAVHFDGAISQTTGEQS